MAARVYYGWWIVVACFFIAFSVGGVVFYSFTCFFEPIVADLGWSYTQVSLAASLRGLEMGLFAPIVGFVVDRYGPRKLILSGAIAAGFGLVLLSLTNSLVVFYCAFVILALGTGGCTSVVLMVAVANWFRRNLGKAAGVTACGFGASGLLVPLTVWLIDTYQWRISLVILAGLMWLLAVPLSFVIQDRPKKDDQFPSGEEIVNGNAKLQFEERGAEAKLKSTLTSSSFRCIVAVETIRMMTLMAVVTHVMPYLSSIGMSRVNAGIVASAVPLLSIAGRFGFGWLGDLLDKRRVIASTLFLMALGMIAFAHAEVRWAVLPFLLLFSPAYGGGVTLITAITREYFGITTLGRTLGIMMGLVSIGGIVGPTLAGWSFDSFGTYRYIWLTLSALNIMAIPVILVARPSPRS